MALLLVIASAPILSVAGESNSHLILSGDVRSATSRQDNFGQHFQALGVRGSIIIYDPQKNRRYQHNPQRNTQAFLPASTFKILNSLIALETGVATDELTVLTWDGIDRLVPDWNKDLTMKEAFKVSAVWYYQVLARRLGYEKMQQWVNQVGYGNQKIGRKEDLDRFWLQGDLRITPLEQIQFLQRLYQNKLPFGARWQAIVKNMMLVEQAPSHRLRAKSGWVGYDGKVNPQVGWYVGYLEQGNNVYFFATNIEIKTKKDAAARSEITKRCLRELGLLKAQ
jgi:beta-lactamase class D